MTQAGSTFERLMLHATAPPDFWNPPMNGGGCSRKPVSTMATEAWK